MVSKGWVLIYVNFKRFVKVSPSLHQYAGAILVVSGIENVIPYSFQLFIL